MSTYTDVKISLEDYAEYCKQQRDAIGEPKTVSEEEEYVFRDNRYLRTLQEIEERQNTSM